jgi:methylmalonyl-CoA mutase
MKNTNHLFAEFPPVSKAEWLAVIEKDLKGKSPKSLFWQLDGLTIDPFPHTDDLPTLPEPLHGAGNDWEIGENIPAHDLVAANRQALRSLEGGISAPRFILDENLGDHRMDSLLEGIELPLVSTHFLETNKNANPHQLLLHFYHIAKAKGFDSSQLRGSVNWSHPEAMVDEDALETLEFVLSKLPAFQVLPVNDAPGGSVTEALAHLLRQGNHWLETLTDKGFSPEVVNARLFFSLSIGTDYFVEIASLRALKLLWANVQQAWGIGDSALPPIEAHLAPESRSEDLPTNMIRATTQAMSAVIGGAKRLTLNGLHAGQTDFTNRIARNVQHILKMESHFDQVADPAAGSYFIENLTVNLAEAAWGRFGGN